LLQRMERLQSELDAAKKAQQKTAAELKELKGQLTKNTAAVDKVADAKAPQQGGTPAQPVSSGPVFNDTLWHIAGFASANYRASTGDEDRAGKINSFLGAQFNPVFHFLYKDSVLFEGELEFQVDADGATEVALEYASIDWLATDYATLVFGQFLSTVGYWLQNMHPSWINKLPDAPAGFGHGGVSPLTDVGVMVRGGFELPRAFEHEWS